MFYTLALPGGGNFTLVDDSYNANPTSMTAALDALAARPAKRRLVALGVMGELGPDAARMHADLAPVVEASRAEKIWLAGQDMRALAGALPESLEQHWAQKAHDLLEGVQNALCDGDVLLIKGSNTSGMVQFADALRQWSAGTDERVLERGVEHAAKGL